MSQMRTHLAYFFLIVLLLARIWMPKGVYFLLTGIVRTIPDLF